MPTPKLSPAQERLLRHLADNPLGVNCDKRWPTFRVLLNHGLATWRLGSRIGMPTVAGIALVREWKARRP
jgi:hypothetical protein